MRTMKATVRNGHLVMDEPTELPEGTVIEVVALVDTAQDLDEAGRLALQAALAEGIAQADVGDTIDADEVLMNLRVRAS